MNTYEKLLIEADRFGLDTKEKLLSASDGRIFGNKVAIRRDIPTTAEKACVLVEELGHHLTTCGDIIDLQSTSNRKQELRARLWGYNHQIGLQGIVNAYKHGCQNRFEMAEYLDVTEEYITNAITAYRGKYGAYTTIDNYVIFFEPALMVIEMY